MGTSYQTLLVVGDLPEVREGLAGAGVDGLVAPAGSGRVAVLPREGDYDYVDTVALAESLHARHGWPTMSNIVFDSDVVYLHAFRHGQMWQEFVSAQSGLVDWFIDHDGSTRFRLDGVEYPADAPYPTGPRGDDPHRLTFYGIGRIDPDRLAAALRCGRDADDATPAEVQRPTRPPTRRRTRRRVAAAWGSTTCPDADSRTQLLQTVTPHLADGNTGPVALTA